MTILEAVDRTRAVLASEPARAVVRLRAEGHLDTGARVDLKAGAHLLVADEPVSMGGGGSGPNPVQMVLASLASCQAITYRYWSEYLDIPFDEITVRVEGDIDQRSFLGISDEAPAGPWAVDCYVTVSGPAGAGRYQELARAVDAHCPVLDVFTRPVAVETHLEVGPTA